MDHNRFDQLTKIFASRASRRAALAATFSGIAAASSARATVARQDATPAATPVASNQVEVEFLFVQQFDSGTWTPKEGEDGVYTLTLTGGTDQTIAFSDRPNRLVTTFPTDDLLGQIAFTPASPPNAAVAVQGPEGRDVIVVQLTGETFDTDTNSVTYSATVLSTYESGRLSKLAGQQNDAELPAEFGAGSLFIDSVSRVCDEDNCLVSCCGTTRARCVHFLDHDDCDHD